MKKLNTVTRNNIQNGLSFREESVHLTTALSENIIPDRSFQKVVLLTLIVLGNVAWVPPSYGMNKNEDDVRTYAGNLHNRLNTFQKSIRTNEDGLSYLSKHWAGRFDRLTTAILDLIGVSTQKAQSLDISLEEQNQYVNQINQCFKEKNTIFEEIKGCNEINKNFLDQAQEQSVELEMCRQNLKTTEQALIDQENSCSAKLSTQEKTCSERIEQAHEKGRQDYEDALIANALKGAVYTVAPEIMKDIVKYGSAQYFEYTKKYTKEDVKKYANFAGALTQLGTPFFLAAYEAYSTGSPAPFLPAVGGVAAAWASSYVLPKNSDNSIIIGITTVALGTYQGLTRTQMENCFRGTAISAGGSVLAHGVYGGVKNLGSRAYNWFYPLVASEGVGGTGEADNPDRGNSPKVSDLDRDKASHHNSDDGNPPTTIAQKKENNSSTTKENVEKAESNELLEKDAAENKKCQEDLKRSVGKMVQNTTTYESFEKPPVNPTLSQALAPLQPLLLQLSEMNLESKPYEPIQKNLGEIMNLLACLNASIERTSMLEENLTPPLDKFTNEITNLNKRIESLSSSNNEEASVYSLEYIDQLKYKINDLF